MIVEDDDLELHAQDPQTFDEEVAHVVIVAAAEEDRRGGQRIEDRPELAAQRAQNRHAATETNGFLAVAQRDDGGVRKGPDRTVEIKNEGSRHSRPATGGPPQTNV